MQEAYLFEYAVLRIVPRVEREEFLNTGVILYCKDLRFLQTIITIDTNRLLTFAPKLDLEELGAHLQVISNRSAWAILQQAPLPNSIWPAASAG